MDIALARTFLAVAEAGSFVAAAERLYVTQSTVSTRIKGLEDQLGKVLFERGKSGAALTASGERFEKHALALVRVWEQARLEVSLPSGYQAALDVGGSYSLWDGFLLEWLALLRTGVPAVAIRTRLGFSSALMQSLIEGTLDFAVMYTPQNRPGLEVEKLFDEEIVMVSSEARPGKQPGRNYVYVDWGPEFQADHSLNFPGVSTPGLYMDLGSLGLRYLLRNQASGYFPKRLVQPFLDRGTLKLIEAAPTFSYPAYVVHQGDAALPAHGRVLRTLRQLAAETGAR